MNFSEGYQPLDRVRAQVQLPEFPGISVAAVPAPWVLRGRGYLLLFRPHRHDRARAGWGGAEARGFGALIVADYADSDAGPYQELLYIPGKLPTPGGWRHRITRIFVSTYESVVNGRVNWAIPKHRADFRFVPEGAATSVTVAEASRVLFQARFRPVGPRFPIHTALLPFPLSQPDGDQWVHTAFFGSGTARLAEVSGLGGLAEQFPDLSGVKPLAALAIEPFRITFPVAQRDKPRP